MDVTGNFKRDLVTNCFLFFVTLSVCDALNVSLSVNPTQVKVGDSLQLTCSIDQDEGLGLVKFNEDNAWKIAVYELNNCGFLVLPDSDGRPFNMTCDTAGLRWFQLQLDNVTAGEHGKVWRCEMTSASAATGQCVGTTSGPNPCVSNDVTVFVVVSVQTVQMKRGNVVLTESRVEVREDTSFVLTCDTGPGGSRPAATLTWRRRRASGGDEVITTDVTIESPTPVPGETDIMIASSRFQVNSRRYNTWQINCRASNAGGILDSVMVTLDVKYKPDLELRVGNQIYTEYQVVENDQNLVLTCYTLDANPSPVSFTWKHGTADLQTSQDTYQLTNVSTSADGTYTCQSDNGYGLGVSNSMSLTVNIPPGAPTFSLQSTVVLGTLSVITGDDVAVDCIADGKPAPDNYQWLFSSSSTGETTSSSVGEATPGGEKLATTRTLTLNNIQPASEGQYSCRAENTMLRTGGNSEIGHSVSQLTIAVLFPPSSPTFTLQSAPVTGPVSVVQGDTVAISCNTNSKPSPDSYQWSFTPASGGTTIPAGTTTTDRTLTLNNIQTTSAGRYSCRVQNTMTRTVGGTQLGTASSVLEVTVFYGASVTEFNVTGQRPRNRTITVDENEALSFQCFVDSNPSSNISIVRDGNVVESGHGITSLSKDYKAVGCLDSGTYTCSARNHYNQDLVISSPIHFFVTCSPRLDQRHATVRNYSKGVGDSVSFSAVVIAYPLPTSYIWYSHTATVPTWEHLVQSEDVTISSKGLNSTLTISGIGEDDYGEYRLDVMNEKGTTSVLYRLQPYSIPSSPSEFENVGDPGATSITLKWMSGSSGGLLQNFTIQYKRSMDEEWKERLVHTENEKGDLLFATITNLQPATTYLFRIWSTNAVGSSPVSGIITSTTAASDVPPCRTQDCDKDTGLIAGVAVAGFVCGVLLTVLAGYVFLRKRLSMSGTQPMGRGAYQTPSERSLPKDDSKSLEQEGTDYYNTASTPATEYEELGMREERPPEPYAELKVGKHANEPKVYENTL